MSKKSAHDKKNDNLSKKLGNDKKSYNLTKNSANDKKNLQFAETFGKWKINNNILINNTLIIR